MKKNLKLYIIICVIITIIILAFNYLHNKYNWDMGEKWYENNNFILHAMGGIDSYNYTNSLEAFEYNYEKGARVFEADFILTKDKQIVLNHDWKDKAIIPSLKEFKEIKVYDIYTPLSFNDLVRLMKIYEDIYIIVDIKENNIIKVEELIYIMINTEGFREISDKFIIQIYNESMLELVEKIHNFKTYIFSTYKLRDRANYEEIAKFCIKNNISVITIPEKYYNENVQNIMDKYNIKIYLHTINNEEKMNEYFKLGVYGIYTDFLF